ncbi:MAG: septum formation initiator family protein [Bacteroidales bacterium]|nr:septum formation initiator family protein [Candidatus Cacconaster caballi]
MEEDKKKLTVRERIAALKERRIWRILLNKYFIVAVIFFVIIGFIDANSIGQFFRNRVILRSQKEQIRYYEREIKAAETKLEQLNSRKDSLEKFAREEYYYLEDGETVYLVEGGEEVPSSSEE